MSVQDISNDKNYLQNSVADPDFQRRGWWGGGGWAVIQTLRKGGGRLPQNFGPQFVLIIRRGPAPNPPPSCPSPGSATEIIYNLVKLREF